MNTIKKLIAVAAVVVAAGCASQPSVVGADGYRYYRVTTQRELDGGLVFLDEWQREGQRGKGKPTYFRLLQSKSDVAPPMFTRSGSNWQ